MIGCGLLLVSLLILVMSDVVGLESACLVVTALVDEGRTERRSVLLKGKDGLPVDDETEDWAGREVEATAEVIDFLTASTAAAPASEAFESRFLAPVLRLASRPVVLDCAGVQQLWSWGNR